MSNELQEIIKQNSNNNSVSLSDENFDPREPIMNYYEDVMEARQDMWMWLLFIALKYPSFSQDKFLFNLPVRAESGFANRRPDIMDHLETYISRGLTFNQFVADVTLTLR